jgi:hypothetical protein
MCDVVAKNAFAINSYRTEARRYNHNLRYGCMARGHVMNIKKRKAKIREMTEFSAKAHRRAAEYAQAQLHFLRLALEIGRDLGPTGPMAGFRG